MISEGLSGAAPLGSHLPSDCTQNNQEIDVKSILGDTRGGQSFAVVLTVLAREAAHREDLYGGRSRIHVAFRVGVVDSDVSEEWSPSSSFRAASVPG